MEGALDAMESESAKALLSPSSLFAFPVPNDMESRNNLLEGADDVNCFINANIRHNDLFDAATEPHNLVADTNINGNNNVSTNNAANNNVFDVNNGENGCNQPQVVSYGGSAYLVHPTVDGVPPLISPLDSNNFDNGFGANPVNMGNFGNIDCLGNPNDLSASSTSAAEARVRSVSDSFATRVAPATIAWLIANYETAEGVSLPRSTLYTHYQHHCSELGQEPVNAASFGKLIRSVFVGLKTRRIGTRGNSKYHYYGIRVKAESKLHELIFDNDDNNLVINTNANSLNIANHARQRGEPVDEETCDTTDSSSLFAKSEEACCLKSSKSSKKSMHILASSLNVEQMAPHLGRVVTDINDFPDLELNTDLKEAGRKFANSYRQHCVNILHAVHTLNFAGVHSILFGYWRAQSPDLDEDEETEDLEELLLKDLFISLEQGSQADVHKFVLEADLALYQAIIDYLMPNVRANVPSTLVLTVRNFAKNIDLWMQEALDSCSTRLAHIKMSAVGALCSTLRRYTGLNHLAQASRAVLANATQTQQMLADLNRIDLGRTQEQARFVCNCPSQTVAQVIGAFKQTLEMHSNIDDWIRWLETTVDHLLDSEDSDKEDEDQENNEHLANLNKRAKDVLLKWSYYSSLIMRDLTLRSSPTFGSFHLIRLLVDEALFHAVELKLAAASGKSAVAMVAMINMGGVAEPRKGKSGSKRTKKT